MAKQFGVSDEAIAGLNDPERFPFPPGQAAALRFADAMTREADVSEDLFRELHNHFSEPQVVEIASVIGLFNYFNRFNNALRVDITLTDPDALVRRVEQAVAAAGGADASVLCDRVAEILAQGRRYLSVGIYLKKEGSRTELAAHRGATPPIRSPRSKVNVPIRGGDRVAGVIDVESDREAAFDQEERSLIERVAALLVPALRLS